MCVHSVKTKESIQLNLCIETRLKRSRADGYMHKVIFSI